MHERDRQTERRTDRPRNGKIDRDIRNRLSAMSFKVSKTDRLIINKLTRETI